MKYYQYLALLGLTNLCLATNAVALKPIPRAAQEGIQPQPPGQEKIDAATNLLRAGKLEEASAMVEEMEKAGPAASQIYNLQGAIATQQRNFKGARVAFTKALELASNDAEREYATFNLAEMAFVTKSFASAYEQFNKVLKLTKRAESKTLIQFKLYICEMMQGQQAAAQQRMASMPPDSVQKDYSAVVSACIKGNLNEAQTLLDAARKTHGAQLAGVYVDALIEMGWSKDGKTITVPE